MIKIPKAAYAEVMLHHVRAFEDKVEAISMIPPFKPLSIREIRRLAPCFHLLVSVPWGSRGRNLDDMQVVVLMCRSIRPRMF